MPGERHRTKQELSNIVYPILKSKGKILLKDLAKECDIRKETLLNLYFIINFIQKQLKMVREPRTQFGNPYYDIYLERDSNENLERAIAPIRDDYGRKLSSIQIITLIFGNLLAQQGPVTLTKLSKATVRHVGTLTNWLEFIEIVQLWELWILDKDEYLYLETTSEANQ